MIDVDKPLRAGDLVTFKLSVFDGGEISTHDWPAEVIYVDQYQVGVKYDHRGQELFKAFTPAQVQRG